MEEENKLLNKLNKVISLIENSGQTSYTISKNTGMSPQTITRIRNRSTEMPNERTLDSLISYFSPEDKDGAFQQLALSQFEDTAIIEYIVENEERLSKNTLFRLWIQKKVSDGIISQLRDRIK